MVKKKGSKPAKTLVTKAILPHLSIGDIVVWVDEDGTEVGPGRLCADKPATESACIHIGNGIGCVQVTRRRLRLAPPGSTAPTCDDCQDC